MTFKVDRLGDAVIAERATRIRPVARFCMDRDGAVDGTASVAVDPSGQLFWLKPKEMTETLVADLTPDSPAEVVQIGHFIGYFEYASAWEFCPTLAEVLCQIPEPLLTDAVGFEIAMSEVSSRNCLPDWIHWCPVIVYGKASK